MLVEYIVNVVQGSIRLYLWIPLVINLLLSLLMVFLKFILCIFFYSNQSQCLITFHIFSLSVNIFICHNVILWNLCCFCMCAKNGFGNKIICQLIFLSWKYKFELAFLTPTHQYNFSLFLVFLQFKSGY